MWTGQTSYRMPSARVTFGGSVTDPSLADIYEAVAEARDRQESALDFSDELLTQTRKLGEHTDLGEFNNAIAEWNGIIREHNEAIGRASQLQRELRDRLPAVQR
jgi:hypothetical protein